MKPDNAQHYGTISRLFHWLTVLAYAIVVYTIIAWTINEDNLGLIGVHQSIGFLLFLLTIARFSWAIRTRHTRPKNEMIVHIGHGLMYILMFTVPFIGILRQFAGARKNLEVFGFTVLPTASQKIEWLTQLGNTFHSKLGYVLFCLIIGHVFMAILHQIRGEKIINRMIGR